MTCQHDCRCQQSADMPQINGVALQTQTPTVIPRLREALPMSEKSSNVFIARGDGFVQRVRTLLEPMSEMERRSIRAVPLRPDGNFDGWAAAPVDDVLR